MNVPGLPGANAVGPSQLGTQPAQIGASRPSVEVSDQVGVAAAPSQASAVVQVGQKSAKSLAQDAQELKQAVAELNAKFRSNGTALEFSIDDSAGKEVVVKLIDRDTMDVIRQYPSKEMLAVKKQIDQFQGSFLKTKA